MVHARFLAPLVKARGFGMAHLKISLRDYFISAQVDALRRVPYSEYLQSETCSREMPLCSDQIPVNGRVG
jgi:hypothetical protein